MSDLSLAYKVRSYSTGTPGRAICNARTHHWVADASGGEMVGAGELFLSGIAACAVNMVEGIARDDEIALEWMDVSVESYRDPAKVQGDLDRKSTRLNSSHVVISYAVFCLKKKKPSGHAIINANQGSWSYDA